jgi:ribosomal protein S17E
LLSNVPGFQVDPNGRISFNGKPIKKLMLDGDDLTAENYQLISRNLRSLMIDSIQVLERYNENRLLKNFDENKDVAINLVLKKSYYGKSTINILAAYSPQELGELQSELVRLRKKVKQYLLINANDIGTYPLQNHMIAQLNDLSSQEVLFHSWPSELHINLVQTLPKLYVNPNRDWGMGLANSIKLNEFNQLRINFRKSNHHIANQTEHNQQFSLEEDLKLGLYSLNSSKYQFKENNLLVQWERDRRKKSTSKYEFHLYNDRRSISSREQRIFSTPYQISSIAILSTRGVKFMVNHSWKSKSKHIWFAEAYGDGSANMYQVFIQRNDIGNQDTLMTALNQTVKQRGFHTQVAIGHYRAYKKTYVKYLFKSSVSNTLSSNNSQYLKTLVFKSYMFSSFSLVLTKKLRVETQSMLGAVDFRINSQSSVKMIYHLDQTFVWKKKATHQLSLNYGVLRQTADVRRFFAGAIYQDGTSIVNSPITPAFPLSIYSQLNISAMDLYRGLTFGTQFMMRRVYKDYLTAIDLDPFFTVMSQLIGWQQSTLSLNLHLEKIIHPFRFKYRIQLNGMKSINPAQFNGNQFDAINNVFRIGNHLSTNWRKGYNLQFEHQYILSRFYGFSNTSVLWNIRHEFKGELQLIFSPKINTNLSMMRYSGRGFITLDLVDLKLNCIPKNTYRLYVQGYNLLNKRVFVQQIINVNSIDKNIQQLVGRRFILGLDFPFN